MNAPVMHGNELQPAQKICANCQTSFAPTKRWQRFCAPRCRDAWHHKKKIGPDGRLNELEEKVAQLEERISRLEGVVVP